MKTVPQRTPEQSEALAEAVRQAIEDDPAGEHEEVSVGGQKFSRWELQFQLWRRAKWPALSTKMGWTVDQEVTVEELEAELAQMAPEPPRVVTVGQLTARLAPEMPRVVTGGQLAAAFAELAVEPNRETDRDAPPAATGRPHRALTVADMRVLSPTGWMEWELALAREQRRLLPDIPFIRCVGKDTGSPPGSRGVSDGRDLGPVAACGR